MGVGYKFTIFFYTCIYIYNDTYTTNDTRLRIIDKVATILKLRLAGQGAGRRRDAGNMRASVDGIGLRGSGQAGV